MPEESKEVAAAILTQVYFNSSPTAAKRVNAEVDADSSKGVAPAKGAMATVFTVYKEMLGMISK